MKKFIIVLIMILMCYGEASPSPLPSLAVDSAYTYLYLREKTGNNDAPEIDKFLAYLGLPPKLSWCAAFGIYNYKLAADRLGVKQPLPRMGRVSMLYQTCQKNPYKYEIITAKRAALDIKTPKRGDLVCWSSGKVAGNTNWAGHLELYIKKIDNAYFQSIGGNTGPGAKGSQREGNGVYVRTRNLGIGKRFQVEGFIRVK